MSRDWIGIQFLPAQLRQPINPLAQIDCLNGNQDAHLRRYLNHFDSHMARLNPASSAPVTPFHWMRSLPWGPSNSIRHSDAPAPSVNNSRNAGGDSLSRASFRATG